MRGLCALTLFACIGCADRSVPLEDGPLGPKIHFCAIHYAEGQQNPRQLVIRGTLDGPGQLGLDPNRLTLDSEGKIQGSTCMAYTPITVRIKPVDTPDLDQKGRKVYDLVPDQGKLTRKYSLVLSPTEAGPHHLLIQEGERVVGTYPLVDPDRKEHQELGSKLARTSAEERQAIADIRKLIRYAFRFRVETNRTVTFLYVPDAGAIGRFDPALRGLTNLTHLSFQDGQLGPAGLSSIRHMASLKILDFANSDIDEGGLACVEVAPQLEALSFFGSRGLSDAGVAHFRGLDNLKRLDMRNASFTAKGPKAPGVTDAGLKHLAGLTKLEHLDLQGHHITDEGLKHLRGMTNLQFLALSSPGITDAGLKHLEGLEKLRTLYLDGTRTTLDGRAALKAKLPVLDR